MQLEAITICISYADYLECCIANFNHFDSWHIVTVPNDVETQSLCSRNGLTCHVVDFYGKDGKLFHATNNKAIGINYALEHLAPESWAMLIDADIILPNKFRQRLETLQLSRARLYGVQGRRIVSTPTELPKLLSREIQDGHLDSPGSILGYFQLFSNANPHNRYIPVPNGIAIGQCDDLRFVDEFPPALRALLPFTVLHLGDSYRNWSARITPLFIRKPLELEAPVPAPPPLAAEANVIVDYGAPCFQLPETAILFDISPVAFHENPRSFREQLSTRITKKPISVYIGCEVTSVLLSSLIDLFESLQIEISWIGGNGFLNEAEHFPTVAAVLIHLGPPKQVWSTGTWRTPPATFAANDTRNQVILYVPEEDRIEEAFLCAALIASLETGCVITGRGTNTIYAEWLAHLAKARIDTGTCDAYSCEVPEWANWLQACDGESVINLHLDYCEWVPNILPWFATCNRGYEWSTPSGEMIASNSTAIALGNPRKPIVITEPRSFVTRKGWARAASMLRVPVYLPQSTLLTFYGSSQSVLGMLRNIRFEGASILAASVSPRLLQLLEMSDLISITYTDPHEGGFRCVADVFLFWRATRPIWFRYSDQILPLTVRFSDIGTPCFVLRVRSLESENRLSGSDDKGASFIAEEIGLVKSTNSVKSVV